ncbi:hypothetical protein GWI33_004962 [Rhynchophorus ferrugineus]|uniref:Uncharacterized protein n=1 Tax=Rhynchophorus ferrugineus TaxID=354439 RepID=A0A834IP84_RHYFE|nr:hypothetical protein GWI33_004962 [Rhynchophorus ferrugineus]
MPIRRRIGASSFFSLSPRLARSPVLPQKLGPCGEAGAEVSSKWSDRRGGFNKNRGDIPAQVRAYEIGLVCSEIRLH